MRKQAIGLAGMLGVAALAACSDPLNVKNVDNPDVDRAYSSPALIEQIISTTFQQIHAGIHGSSDALNPQMQVLSFESYGSVANFGMGARASMPRGVLSNQRNNITQAGNNRDFSTLSRRAREAANAVAALDRVFANGGTLGQPGGNNTGLNNRVRAFGLFSNGVALGNLALSYDSAAIVTQAVPSDEIPPLSPYTEVMQAALAQLDSAYNLAALPATATGFPLPTTYFNGNAFTQDQFLRIIRSFRARFRANVARTPAERAAVDWTAVIADAEAGIQSNLVVQLSSAAGWTLTWLGSQMFADDSRGWHQMPMMVYGMADTSGAYDAWIKTPLSDRDRFLVKTPDKRFPSGETRDEQRANSPANAAFAYDKYPYIRNRSGQDTPGQPFGNSYYDFYRFKAVHLANVSGPWVEMPKAETDMLAAEGHIRKGNFAAAVAIIDKYRTGAGLPALGNITSLTQPVPGGNACVPRVPTSAGNATQCGNIMEAMKWEKRMETAFTGYGQWYFDARGWGDLAEGTNIHWPVPYQELDSRQMPIYDIGGIGGVAAAPKGTYGF